MQLQPIFYLTLPLLTKLFQIYRSEHIKKLKALANEWKIENNFSALDFLKEVGAYESSVDLAEVNTDTASTISVESSPTPWADIAKKDVKLDLRRMEGMIETDSDSDQSEIDPLFEIKIEQ